MADPGGHLRLNAFMPASSVTVFCLFTMECRRIFYPRIAEKQTCRSRQLVTSRSPNTKANPRVATTTLYSAATALRLL
jgi:hypothetical protein